MALSEVAADLYGRYPSEFVAARTQQVAAAKEAGDRELAAAIGKLRKPTVTAWAVNLLVRAAPAEVDALLELAAALRTAQRAPTGDRLRELTGERQRLVGALTKRVGTLAADQGHPVSETVLREVGQTLTAALADPAIAEQVHTGTLATAATYDGFGPAGPTLVAVADTAAATPSSKSAAPADAGRELDEALEALESARAARDSAQHTVEQVADRLAEIDARRTALQAELDHVEQERQFTKTGERTAREQLQAAQRQLDRVQRWVARVREHSPAQPRRSPG